MEGGRSSPTLLRRSRLLVHSDSAPHYLQHTDSIQGHAQMWRRQGHGLAVLRGGALRPRAPTSQPPHPLPPRRSQSLSTKPTTTPGPLHGLRVLDLTRVLAGPFATMALGDLGADIIKIEHPQRGDDTRAWGPPFVGGESAYYLCVNRNKRSVGVDFKQPEGLEIVRKLAAESDVLIENFLPGKLEEAGLGYEALSKLNPRLIYCSITGFGSDGPAAQRPGYDVITQGMYGLMSITGSPSDEGGEPAKTGTEWRFGRTDPACMFEGLNCSIVLFIYLFSIRKSLLLSFFSTTRILNTNTQVWQWWTWPRVSSRTAPSWPPSTAGTRQGKDKRSIAR